MIVSWARFCNGLLCYGELEIVLLLLLLLLLLLYMVVQKKPGMAAVSQD